MKHTFSRSFATRLSIYVLSFTLIIFATIMALFYYYSHQKVTDFAIERTHGLLSNIATEISRDYHRAVRLDIGKKHRSPGFFT